MNLKITYIGGPTALLEFAGVQLLTDPTFDPAGGEYKNGPVTLRKTAGPALSAESLSFDIVLLSHDHHFDNLDHSGRASLARAQNNHDRSGCRAAGRECHRTRALGELGCSNP
jgi:L-ascorbate metabolism protein UlaG (beta-lactamase superfamily)